MKKIFSKMKRWICVCTAAAVLLGLNAVIPAVAKPYVPEVLQALNTSLLSVDFANATEADIPIAANAVFGAEGKQVKAVGVGAVPPVITTDGEMKFSVVAGSKAQFQDASGSGFTGDAVYEFKFMLTALPTGTMELVRGTDRDGNYQSYRLYLKNDGQIGIGDAGCAVSASANAVVTPGKWYTVKFVTDMAAQTYDCYINGVLEAENLMFKGRYDNASVTVSNIGRPFAFLEKAGLGTLDVYYDDLNIYTEPSGRRLITADDFSGYATDVTYAPRVSDLFAGMRIIDTSGAQPTGIKVSAANERIETNGAAILTAYGSNHLKKLITEFDFMPTVINVDQGKIYSAADRGGNAYGIELYLTADNRFVASTEAGDVVLYEGVQANQSYSFKVYADLTKTFEVNYNGTVMQRPGMYDIYINGKCAGAGLQFKYTKKDFANLTNLGRIFGIGTSAASEATYYDNIAIYTDEREEVLSAAANALMSLCNEGDLSAAQITLPDSAMEGYTVFWTSSDETVINPQTGEVAHGDAEQKVTLTATVSDTGNQHSVSGAYEINVTSNKGIKSYLDEDFENLTAVEKGDIMGDFKVVSAAGLRIDGDDSNHYLALDAAEAEQAVYQSDIQVTKPAMVVTEFAFMQPQKSPIERIFSSNNVGGMDTLGIIYSDGYSIRYLSGEKQGETDRDVVLIRNYEENTWYTIKVYHNTNTKEYEIYVDDICRANHAPFRQTLLSSDYPGGNPGYANFPAVFHRIRFGSIYKTPGYAGTMFYIDNLKVYSSTEMDDLYRFAKLEGSKPYTEPVALPAETMDGDAVAWTSDTHTIENNQIAVGKEDAVAAVRLTATAGGLTKQYEIEILAQSGVQMSEQNGSVTSEIYYDDDSLRGCTPTFVTAIYDAHGVLKKLTFGAQNGNYITASVDTADLSVGTYTLKTFVWQSMTTMIPLNGAESTFTISDSQ